MLGWWISVNCPKCGSEMLYEHHFVGEELVYDNTRLECPECGHSEKVMTLEACEKLCRTCPEKETCSGALEWGVSDEEKVKL